jgi:hypothetical protein
MRSRALLLALLLSGCGGRVVVDTAQTSTETSPPDAGGGVDPCVAACAALHPDGTHMFLIFGCYCDGCSEACTANTCGEATLPSSACLGCVQAGFLGDWCQNHEGLFDFCTHDVSSDCHAFAECMLACPTVAP